MTKMLLGTLFTLVCIASVAAQANTPQLEVPPVLLTDLAVPITISEPGSQQLSLFIDDELVFEGFPSDGQT
ncbi:MAG: Na+/H+ antiporter NhaC family protein, partial [Halieaceae bacterium]|nr:Na+/H+ antiporter NhaC family protein [Halieaceae bacterium]